MKLTYIGHACFRLTAADGTTIITDPYDASVGCRMVSLRADMITMSHGHHDHCETSMIEGSPVILRGTEQARVGSVSAAAVASWHDDANGTKRGPNTIRIFTVDGMKIVHMGDQGCMPDEQVLAAISGADVMLMPVGGFFTAELDTVMEILEKAAPRCVVPMHFKTRGCGYPIAGVAPFLHAMGMMDAVPQREMELTPQTVPQGVVLMQPEADEI